MPFVCNVALSSRLICVYISLPAWLAVVWWRYFHAAVADSFLSIPMCSGMRTPRLLQACFLTPHLLSHTQVGFVVAERVLYTPCLGFCIFAASAIDAVARSSNAPS